MGFVVSVSLLALPIVTIAQVVTTDGTTASTDTTATDSMATTTPEETVMPEADSTPPEIVSVSAVSLEPTGATIMWTTDELASCSLEYGRTVQYGSATAFDAQSMEHVAMLADLAPETSYHYRITCEDAAGNRGTTGDYTFTTSAEPVVADEQAPSVTEINVSNITTSAATIDVRVDELSQAYVEYGKTVSYGTKTPLSDEFSESHHFQLSDLAADTVYHFRVVVNDESGNTAMTPDETFATEASPEEAATTTEPVAEPVPNASTSTPPVSTLAVSNVETASVGTSTARITWSTNREADGRVEYGTTNAYSAQSPIGSVSLSHEVRLTNLAPDTLYYYQVVSTAGGASARSGSHEFTTLVSPKTVIVPPVISNVAHLSGASTAEVSWNTSTLATSEIEYGTTTSYGVALARSGTRSTSHTRMLLNLVPDSVYHFRIKVRDAAGNTVFGKDRTLTTFPFAEAMLSNASSTIIGEIPVKVKPVVRFAPSTPSGFPTAPSQPRLLKTEGLDGQIMFNWEREFRGGTLQTLIVRKEGSRVTSTIDGEVVYSGSGQTFTDTDVENGTTYHYAVYVFGEEGQFSLPVRYSITPQAGNDEVTLSAVPRIAPSIPLFTFARDIAPKETSESVAHAQAVLAHYPKLYPEGLVTGYYGSRTAAAISRLQEKYNFPVTGEAGPATRAKLQLLARVPRIQDESVAATFERDLSLGMQGDDVSQLQQFLVDAGQYPEALVTGFFGPLTQQALARFQKTHDISPASGYFGSVTRSRVQILMKAGLIQN